MNGESPSKTIPVSAERPRGSGSQSRMTIPATTVLAIVTDQAARDLFPKVVQRDPLFLTGELNEALALAEAHPPDIAFVEIAGGAGLAMVHHLKAVVPSVTIIALASRSSLEAAANVVALGGAGLLMMPIGGDEVLSAIAAVKVRISEKTARAELDRAGAGYARAAGWMGRIAELADRPTRTAAAEELAAVLTEATGGAGAAVYLVAGDRPSELTRAAVSSGLEGAPAFGMESDVLDHARRERLLAVPLATRGLKAGHVLIAQPAATPSSTESTSSLRSSGGHGTDGLVKLLAKQAAAAFTLLGERERAGSAPMKDPGSSAYSFAYYVDIAGREIDKARRYGRRFAIATVALESTEGPPTARSSSPGPAPASAWGPPEKHLSAGPVWMSPPEMADQLLLAARDTDVLARVDEHEFHLLMPETDGLGAHACRRRVLGRFLDKGGRAIPRGLLVGVATFPHDGQDLAQLLRVARRRAEATRGSIVHRLGADPSSLTDLLDALEWEVAAPLARDLAAPRAIELPLPDAVALATSVVGDALRGGAAIVAVAHHQNLSLGAAVRASLGPPRENVVLHALDVSASHGDDIEALSIIAEHGAYAFLGRSHNGVVRGLHAADPLLADLLAERLGRAAGLRIFA